MQLTRRTLPSKLPIVLAAALLCAAARPAFGADDTVATPGTPAAPVTPVERKLPTDATTKRASLEMAAYSDSDHVGVFTPSVGMTIDNVITGASLRARYLV